MNTRYIAAEYRLSHWAQIMKERKETGLSIRAYCEGSGIHENTFFYWQKKLRDATGDENYLQQGDIVYQQTPRGFTEIKMAGQLALPAAASSQKGQLSIEGAGLRITADSSYPIDNLAALLRTVARIC